MRLTKVGKYANLVGKFTNFEWGDLVGELDTKIIPMPRERECTALLGEDNEVTGYILKNRINRLGVHWVATFQDGMAWLAKQDDITGEQLRVFLYLVSRLDFDNYLKVPQKDISEDLNLHKSNVSKAIKKLVEKDIITVGPMAGHSKTYRLNPRIAHRGAKNYKETVIQYDALKKAQQMESPT